MKQLRIVKQQFCFVLFILLCSSWRYGVSQTADKDSSVPGIAIAHSPAPLAEHIGSPAITILPDGDYLVAHDLFGANSLYRISGRTRIYRSSDKGQSWKLLSQVTNQLWSSLFVVGEDVYLLGTTRRYGDLVIRRSADNGVTWSVPKDSKTGILRRGGYHTAPTPVIRHKGRLWRAMEHLPDGEGWGLQFRPFLMSAEEGSDLLDSLSWAYSDELTCDKSYLGGNFNGWLEGNAVIGKDGNLVNVLRVDDYSTLEEKAAVIQLDVRGESAYFNPDSNFISFPGGSKKFSIRYDSISQRYWTISNYIPDGVQKQHPKRNPASIRNTIGLFSSKNMKDWEFHELLLHHPDEDRHGFQYVDWVFDKGDIIYVSRTAYEDEFGGANNNHDANFLTFHRVGNFRKLVNQSSL